MEEEMESSWHSERPISPLKLIRSIMPTADDPPPAIEGVAVRRELAGFGPNTDEEIEAWYTERSIQDSSADNSSPAPAAAAPTPFQEKRPTPRQPIIANTSSPDTNEEAKEPPVNLQSKESIIQAVFEENPSKGFARPESILKAMAPQPLDAEEVPVRLPEFIPQAMMMKEEENASKGFARPESILKAMAGNEPTPTMVAAPKIRASMMSYLAENFM